MSRRRSRWGEGVGLSEALTRGRSCPLGASQRQDPNWQQEWGRVSCQERPRRRGLVPRGSGLEVIRLSRGYYWKRIGPRRESMFCGPKSRRGFLQFPGLMGGAQVPGTSGLELECLGDFPAARELRRRGRGVTFPVPKSRGITGALDEGKKFGLGALGHVNWSPAVPEALGLGAGGRGPQAY